MTEKTCSRCAASKPLSEFNRDKSKPLGVAVKCRSCEKAAYQQDRDSAVAAYGGACVCCGEDEPVFLAIDHVDGGGSIHRKETSDNIARWLRQNDYPEGFQLLCHNCNWAKHRLGECPHERLKKDISPGHGPLKGIA